MSVFYKVAETSELPPGSKKCVMIGSHPICLINLNGTLHAIDDTCTHAEASLCGGEIAGNEIVCPLHFATFDIATGEATGPPACEPVNTYEVRINGEAIEVAM